MDAIFEILEHNGYKRVMGDFGRPQDALGLFPAFRDESGDTIAVIDLPHHKLALDYFHAGYGVFESLVEGQRNHIADIETFVCEAMDAALGGMPGAESPLDGLQSHVPSFRDLPNDLARWGALKPGIGEPLFPRTVLEAAGRVARNLREGKVLISYPNEPRQRSTKVLKSPASIWKAGRIEGSR